MSDPIFFPDITFGTPRKLPRVADLKGRVVVLDVAFAGVQGGGFEKVTLPFIRLLGDRLRAWVDHHDHTEHQRYANDPRFRLRTKAQHGACPELVDPELVERIGPYDTICCHNDFDGLASAAKWIRGGQEPYPGCDADARCIDTRIGVPSAIARRVDRALRARPRDQGLQGLVVRYLSLGLGDASIERILSEAAAELDAIEQETASVAERYVRMSGGVAAVDVTTHQKTIDKTQLLLFGQQLERVSVVVDRENVSVAASFDSGLNFLTMFGLAGGMPTRISLPRNQLRRILSTLGVSETETSEFVKSL